MWAQPRMRYATFTCAQGRKGSFPSSARGAPSPGGRRNPGHSIANDHATSSSLGTFPAIDLLHPRLRAARRAGNRNRDSDRVRGQAGSLGGGSRPYFCLVASGSCAAHGCAGATSNRLPRYCFKPSLPRRQASPAQYAASVLKSRRPAGFQEQGGSLEPGAGRRTELARAAPCRTASQCDV